jgi:hypothetical protein
VKLGCLERFSSWERASLLANSFARLFQGLFKWPFIYLRQRKMFLRLMVLCRMAQSTHELVRNFLHGEKELSRLEEAYLTKLC